MKRREFIAALGGAAAMWPLCAVAQPARKWRIGFLHPGQSATVNNRIAAFREGLGASGPGEDPEIVVRIANERLDQCPRWPRTSSAKTFGRSARLPLRLYERRAMRHLPLRSSQWTSNPIPSQTVGPQALLIRAEISPVSSSTCPMLAQKPCSCCARQCRTPPGSRALASGEWFAAAEGRTESGGCAGRRIRSVRGQSRHRLRGRV
jgi:hypothetical protein